MAGWKAAELEWGRGPRVFEMFLEPTCPYSNKAFGKIKVVLSTVGEDKITVKVRLQSQPWHLYSGVIVRAILAASTLDNGRDAAWRVMEAVAAHREEFEFDKHCTGPNRTATPNDIIARIERYSGIKLAAAFDIPKFGQGGQIALPVRKAKWSPCQPDIHDRWTASVGHEQRRRCVRLGATPC